MTAKTSAERQKASDDRQRALNRKQSKWWLTDEEKDYLKTKLAELRKSAEPKANGQALLVTI